MWLPLTEKKKTSIYSSGEINFYNLKLILNVTLFPEEKKIKLNLTVLN